ncbi:MAG: hypothetical protein M3R24_36825 [Chloroflexota bacterium]|nr:hypothetical protein [Chloroflexota bacterium]
MIPPNGTLAGARVALLCGVRKRTLFGDQIKGKAGQAVPGGAAQNAGADEQVYLGQRPTRDSLPEAGHPLGPREAEVPPPSPSRRVRTNLPLAIVASGIPPAEIVEAV